MLAWLINPAIKSARDLRKGISEKPITHEDMLYMHERRKAEERRRQHEACNWYSRW